MKVELDRLVEAYGQLVKEVGAERASALANRLFRSSTTALTLAIILRDGKVTAVDLQDLGVPNASTYRSLSELQRMGILSLDGEFQASPHGGPRTKVWRVRRSE